MEAGACGVEQRMHDECLPPACFHTTLGRSGNLKRTKLFFGARCVPLRLAKVFLISLLTNLTAHGLWHCTSCSSKHRAEDFIC